MKRFLSVSVMIMQDLKECYSFRKAILPSCCCQPYRWFVLWYVKYDCPHAIKNSAHFFSNDT